ncbi:MAG: PD-(D/E)XK nuclease family protein [Planctomycetota bacterium]
MDRVFLGTDGDALKSAADRILGSHQQRSDGIRAPSATGPFDLRHLVVVVPGRRVIRRLRRLLVEQARQQGRGLLPPRITTPGHLEQTVAATPKAMATPLEERIAWLQALRSSAPDILATIGLEPEMLEAPALLPLVKLLSRLCSDLRRDGITLGTAAELAAAQDPQAALRLRAVESIEAKRSANLQRRGVTDSGTFSAPPISEDLQVILIGILELPVRMRQWLDQHCQTQAWIDADEGAADLYDDFGCPVPEQWQARPCPQFDDPIFSDDPRSLTAALIDRIHQHSSVKSVDEVTIGLVDADLTPWLVEGFRRSQIPLHIAAGTPHHETSCGRLLRDLRSVIDTLSSHSVAGLARHPSVHRSLPREENNKGRVLDPIESIDRWSTRRQPVLATDSGAPAAVHHICKAIEPLRTGAGNCSQRIEQLIQCLRDLVGVDDLGQPALGEPGRENLIEAVNQLSHIVQYADDPLSGLDVVSLLVDLLEETPVPDRHDSTGINVLGWLELPFDGAGLLLLTGVTEGRLSPAPTGDPLLPHGVREELGLPGPRQRYARDTHLLHTLLDGRREVVVAMCSRDGEGNPLLPSRLLLQGSDGIDHLARFLDKHKRTRFHLPETGSESSSPESLGPPRGVVLAPPDTVSITALSDWLEDPVLFQMNQVLGHRDCHDRDRQLNRLDFGTLVHWVLERFGKNSDLRDLTDEEQIGESLHLLLDRYRHDNIADPARSAVLVQLEQARVRLDAWARVQAQQRALGWQLVAAEVSLDADLCRIQVPGGEMGLSGRIDRIDYHPEQDRWRLLDYKTGDNAKDPEKDHRKGPVNNKTWIKLQLPLYRLFAPQLEIDGGPVSADAEVGFFLLPASTDHTRIEIASWSEEDFEQARIHTQDAIEGILAGTDELLTVLKSPWRRALAGVMVESAARLDGITDSEEEVE